MRILHVLDHSLPLHSGYAFRTAAIVREQRALGFETYQLTTPRHRHTSPSIDETVDGIRFLRTPCDRGWRSKVPAWGTYLEEMRATRRRIEELVEQLKPDVVHAHSPILTALPTMAATRRRRVPFVYEVRALWEDGAVSHGTTRPDSMRYRATRHLETLVLRRASHVTTICSGLAGEIASRGVDASRITVIPNAVDADAFRFNPPRDERLAQQLALRDAYVLGFIGSFYGYEGLELLIEATAKLVSQRRDIRLLFVGGGLREESLRKLAADLHVADRIVFAGRVPHEDVPRYYSVIDLLVYPRLKVPVTELVTPLKPLEAMAQGRLLIASDVGGQKELIRDGETGFLFPAGSIDDLVDKVEHILADRSGWQDIRIGARRFVEAERTWKKSVRRYCDVYDAALRTGR